MRWPPYKHIFFDCDSTLTSVEGIDVLAESAGKGQQIKNLTNAAMNGEIDLGDVYGERLKTIYPTRQQVQTIRQVYKKHMVDDAKEVIATLQHLGHKVYIISGGLLEPVREFGIYLGVPANQIRAVGLEYDKLAGNWWQKQTGFLNHQDERYRDYGEKNLTISHGKAQIVRELLGEQTGRSLLIGDGTSDLLASQALDLFVGFGGVVTRERVFHEAPVFIHSTTLAPLLPLALGPAGIHLVHNTPYNSVFQKAFNLIATGAITFQNEQLKLKFEKAYQAVLTRTS